MINRTISTWALDQHFLHGRMAFIAGPRQVGKTTLVKNFLKSINQEESYFNWDSISLKQKFAENPLFFKEHLPPRKKNKSWIIFDEIHKYPNWKNLLKGYYDDYKEEITFVITGSARLDLFRKSGDSLIGRYFLFNMFPLGPKDIVGGLDDYRQQWHPSLVLDKIPEVDTNFSAVVSSLLNLSGFPEPFIDGTRDFYQRWKEMHISLLINEDLRDLTQIVQIKKLETLVFLFSERVGAPLSLNALKRTLQCSHGSVTLWLQALEKIFLVFCLSPFSKKLARAVVKEKKYYFWDWGMVEETGKRFENFIALQLLKAIAVWNEWGKGKYELCYVRTKDGVEVDFAVVKSNKVCMLVESKLSDSNPAKSLELIKSKLHHPLSFQVVNKQGVYQRTKNDVLVLGVDRFLQLLP